MKIRVPKLQVTKWTKEHQIPTRGILVLRHGPRQEILTVKDVHSASLTKEGKNEVI